MTLPCRDNVKIFAFLTGTLLVLIVLVLVPVGRVHGMEPGKNTKRCTTIDVYTATGCPHCRRALEFLQQLRRDYPDLTVRNFNVRTDPQALQRFIEFNRQIGETHPGVPTFLTLSGSTLPPAPVQSSRSCWVCSSQTRQ